jgi:HK97 family phage prohead protease
MTLEMRRAARMAMRGVPERLGLEFARGNIEMRAKPSGTGGTAFTWEGYAAVYDTPFPMWDQDGEPFDETVALGAAKRSLNNPALDVPFLIGHNNAGIPLARTKSGTMQLSDDSHGVLTYVPSMDGRREEVRALASAVERGDLDEMSLAFVCTRQSWDPQYEHRTILELDLHRGDVCAVTHGANQATAGSRMYASEQLAYRRPAAIGGPRLLERRGRPTEARMPTAPYERGADEHAECGQCHSGNDADAAYCDQCGHEIQPLMGYVQHPDDTQTCPWCRCMNGPDAKVCDQCGRGLVNDHDGDDPGYSGGPSSWRFGDDYYAARRPLERRAAMSTAAVNDLPDSAFAYIEPGGTKDALGKTTPRSLRHFPVNDAAHVRNALARAPQSPFGPKALPAIRAAAKRMGIGESEQKALMRPLERRASAAEDADLAAAPDYDAAGLIHDAVTGTHEHPHEHADGEMMTHPHAHDNDSDHGSCGTGAVVTVDDSTGIPGDEVQMSAARKLELRLRDLDMQELASRR